MIKLITWISAIILLSACVANRSREISRQELDAVHRLPAGGLRSPNSALAECGGVDSTIYPVGLWVSNIYSSFSKKESRLYLTDGAALTDAFYQMSTGVQKTFDIVSDNGEHIFLRKISDLTVLPPSRPVNDVHPYRSPAAVFLVEWRLPKFETDLNLSGYMICDYHR